MPYAHVSDAALYYHESGSGEPAILLHNFLATGETCWRKQIPAFRNHYRLIVPDLRGHGRSENPNHEQPTHSRFADDIIALLDALDLESAHFWGVSSGAMLLLTLALRAPLRVRSLVLTAATYRFTPVNQARALSLTPETLPETWAAHWQSIHAPVYGPDYWRTLLAAFHRLNLDGGEANFPPPAALAAITPPTLLIHGDRDEYFPVEIAVALYRLLPNAALCIIPRAGHLPNSQVPAAWNAAVRAFYMTTMSGLVKE